jgi:protein-tyrosine phosphatase
VGYTDLHCHLLFGIDDGAETLEDSLAMARDLVSLGFSDVAPSPHARAQYAGAEAAAARLQEVQGAFDAAGIPLRLHRNAENYLFEEAFLPSLGTPQARLLGAGRYVLFEVPYSAPVPRLPDLLFRIKLKGVTPVIAHPERCLEFDKKGRAEEAVRAGAVLQLDIGSVVGRYGGGAKRLALSFLDEGLYGLGATDSHSPADTQDWVPKAMKELARKVGEPAFRALMSDNPKRILEGAVLES